MKIAVVGGGIFGLTIASVLAEEGFDIDLYEKENDVFKGASGANQYRLHRGYHYPRSIETIKDCISGEIKFRKFYPETIIDKPHEHYYAIAIEGSFLSAEECFEVWKSCGLDFEIINLDIINKDSVEKTVKVNESIIDSIKLKQVCIEKCKNNGVNIFLNKEVSYDDLKKYDLIVSCTYANSNLLLKNFPEYQKDYQFEIVEKPVLKLPEKFKDKSIVIQDGPFTCIDPYGKTGLSLMGNVTKAIHHRNIGKYPEIPEEYKSILNKGIIKNPKLTKIKEFLEDAEKFFPGINNAEHIGSLFTIRTVLPYREYDDARPTVVEKINYKIVSVFSGKIPTCVDAAEEVLEIAKDKNTKINSQNVGIIGIGNWGKNLVRVFHELSNVKICANRGNSSDIEWINKNYPNIEIASNYEDILNDKEIGIVAIATPINTHFELAKKATDNGKKVFLEKPITNNLSDAEKLINNSKEKILFTGHTFLYHPCYNKIKELISIDPIIDIEFNWNKFGTFKEDIFLNLLSHDLSILNGLLEKLPTRIILNKNQSVISDSDIISLNLIFENEENCNININRISPEKRKGIKITTRSGKIYYWVDNKIMELDKERHKFETTFETEEEPLKNEVKEFLKYVENNQEPIENKKITLNVMKMLNMVNGNGE